MNISNKEKRVIGIIVMKCQNKISRVICHRRKRDMLVQRNSVERGFVVFTNLYDLFIFTDPSRIRIIRVPDWHSWGKNLYEQKTKWPQNVNRKIK